MRQEGPSLRRDVIMETKVREAERKNEREEKERQKQRHRQRFEDAMLLIEDRGRDHELRNTGSL